jgi:3-keto-5-aminohexanoate cleavage enzyme
MIDPVLICVAPNGARRSKSDHPALPLSAAELAAEAHSCLTAGAGALHLHVRDAQQQHTLDPQRYLEALSAVRASSGDALVVQVTTESVGRYSAADQAATVRAVRPEAISVAVREMVPSSSEEAAAARFYAWAHEQRVAVQHIVYSPEETQRLLDLVRRRIIPGPAAVLFVLGRYGVPADSEPAALVSFLQLWPDQWPWMVCGFGAQEPRLAAAAIGLGGHVRVGFENNFLRPDGSRADSNAQNVHNSAALARHAGRALAQRADALTVLGAISWQQQSVGT